MNSVLFLGAGASVPAGYPSMSNLLEALERNSKEHANEIKTNSDWCSFQDFKEQYRGPLKNILVSNNLELIFTVLDLLEISNENKSGRAKTGLINELDDYFSIKHHDSATNKENKRNYLLKGFEQLKSGDVVITTNWDTLAELTLFEQKKWHPADGYGFNVSLVGSQDLSLISSDVKVLKLHGSIGWHSHKPITEVYLQNVNFLDHFILAKSPILLHDPKTPVINDHLDPSVMIYPAYLKILDNPIIQSIWEQACQALSQAETIVIVGYSLPSEDIGVRTLLLPLRERIKRSQVNVTIVDTNQTILDRWKDFLGEGSIYLKERAENYFSSEMVI